MSEPVTATISKEWKQRMIIILAVLVGMGGWFLFDGLVAYPRNNVKAAVYFEIRDRLGEDTPETAKAWEEVRTEKGWKPTPPKKIYSDGDMTTQVVLAILSFVGAAAAGLHFFRSVSTTTRMENGVILLPDGRRVPIEKVRATSRKRWENKGIADLAWEPEPGKLERFILDDYKYVGAAAILEEVERALGITHPPKNEETPPRDPGA